MRVEFTRAALQTIREYAKAGRSEASCAAALGWDVGELRRRCREQGIRFEVEPHRYAPKAGSITEQGDFTWHDGELCGRGRAISLSMTRRAIFDLLWPSLRTGNYVSTAALEKSANALNVSSAVCKMRPMLVAFGLAIEAKPRGGYRLVDMRAAPAVPARQEASAP